jgi:signal transduction histidine kinase
MANDLLDVSRMEDGKMPLALEPCDLVSLAKEVVGALGALDPSRVLRVQAPASVQVIADRAVIQRVVENLVNNAIKHTPAGGRVDLVLHGDATRVRIEVHDQGPGVPTEARERIFEKFGTVAARVGHQYHSAGLGLAFCKLAVETHGGRIGVTCVESVGSVFWFELPA